MAVLIVLNLAASVDRTIFAVLAPSLQASLRLSNTQLGLIQGPAFALLYAAALPFAGLLADRSPPRGLLIASLVAWSLGLLLCASASTMIPLVAGRALCGLGQAALAPVALGLIAAGVPTARIGRGIALFTASGTLGRSAAFGLGGLLLALSVTHRGWEDWSAVLIVVAIITVVPLAIALATIRLPAAPLQSGARSRVDQTRDGLSGLWRWVRRSPITTAAMVAAALGPVVIVQAFIGWAVPTLTQAHHLTAARVGGMIGLVSLAAPVGHVAGGWMTDRLAVTNTSGGESQVRRAPLVQAALVLLCIPGAAAFAWAASLAVALTGATVLMLLEGAGAIIGLTRIQQMAPTPIRGSAIGIFLLLANVIGVGGGPYAVGLIASGSIGVALFIVIAGAATVAAICALFNAFSKQIRASGPCPIPQHLPSRPASHHPIRSCSRCWATSFSISRPTRKPIRTPSIDTIPSMRSDRTWRGSTGVSMPRFAAFASIGR